MLMRAANPKENALRPGETTTGPVVVATDGSEASTPALLLAAEMTGGHWSEVKVLAVRKAEPLVHFEIGMLPVNTADVDAARASLRRSVEAQVARIASGPDRPDIIFRDGRIADELAEAASGLRARVLLLGVRHRSLIDRLLEREISLQVLRRSHIPVCVVPEGWSRLPSSIVVATDFSPASLCAARMALELFDSVQRVSVVHVSPHHDLQPAEYVAWLSGPGEDLQRAFDRFVAALDLPQRVIVDAVKLEGHPGHEILRFAASACVDLVVTGSRGAMRFADQMFVGSTAQGLVRAAPCAVFAVRPSAQLTGYGRERIQ